MPATPTQMNKAISPGSLPYGDRQGLEAGITSTFGGTGGAPAAPPVGGGVAPTAADPLGQLLGGGLKPDGGPVTSGLSVGPGPGAAQPSPFAGTEFERLRMLAENAKTPMLRHIARQALRRKVVRGSR